ncbi:calpain-10 [Aplochiton taeniatus]
MKGEKRADLEGLFEDTDFPPDDTSVFSDYSAPIARLKGDITWLRPQEICSSPRLFPDNINEGHAKQGLLGDCWFLCACTILLRNKHLLSKVVHPGQPLWGEKGYRGSFLLCLWQQGHWVEVTIDDRLPCVGSQLCFSRCHAATVFWVALLEKAYAKVQGSYEHLWAGQVSEALVDLTGGVAERWGLSNGGGEKDQGEGQDSDRFRSRKLDLDLLQPVREACALSCSTSSAPGGASELGQHHALSVLEWVSVRTPSGGSVRLLRIRNPWGRRCWGSAWIEGGIGWSSVDPALALDLLGRTEEGEFWLDQTEFLSQFDDVTVGYPINKEGHLQSIYTGELLTHKHQLCGRWLKGHTAGGCRNNSSYSTNPKFWLKVFDRGEVLVSLLQQERCRNTVRYKHPPAEGSTTAHTQHQDYKAIALHMWKVEKRRFNLSRVLNHPPCASTHCHAYEREVVLHTHLEPGYHLLVPSAFLQGAEASFLIRVFSSVPTSLSDLKVPAPSFPSLGDGEWESKSFRGAWVVGSCAGGSRNFPSHGRNPCFPLRVGDVLAGMKEVNVRLTLLQNHPDTDFHPIGFHVYRVPEGIAMLTVPRDAELVASCVPHSYTQDVTLACCLPPGNYVVVPSTYQPDCPGDFTLTVSHRMQRRVVKSQENLGKAIQEGRTLTTEPAHATPYIPRHGIAQSPAPMPGTAGPCVVQKTPVNHHLKLPLFVPLESLVEVAFGA